MKRRDFLKAIPAAAAVAALPAKALADHTPTFGSIEFPMILRKVPNTLKEFSHWNDDFLRAYVRDNQFAAHTKADDHMLDSVSYRHRDDWPRYRLMLRDGKA